MTAYSLTGLAGMGTITKESSDKSCNLFFTPMPGSDSDKAITIDLFGVSRDITLSGKFCSTDSGYASIEAFIVALDGLVAGNQTVRTYVSGKSGVTYNVLIDSVNWETEEGGVNKVDYTIIMKQGS